MRPLLLRLVEMSFWYLQPLILTNIKRRIVMMMMMMLMMPWLAWLSWLEPGDRRLQV